MNKTTIGSLFSGIGGFELGLERGIPNSETIWQVEQNPYCRKVLQKHWSNVPIFEDVRTVGKHNLPTPTILCGGFPCQDISLANPKRRGLDGKKSGLWFEMLRIIGELRPNIVCLENVPALYFSGLGTVLGGLSKNGYDAEWLTLQAKDFNLPHRRRRIFIIAYTNKRRHQHKKKEICTRGASSQLCTNTNITNPDPKRWTQNGNQQPIQALRKRPKIFAKRPPQEEIIFNCAPSSEGEKWSLRCGEREIKPLICRRDDGLPNRLHRNRVARIQALGNAIVPQCSEFIGQLIYKNLLS